MSTLDSARQCHGSESMKRIVKVTGRGAESVDLKLGDVLGREVREEVVEDHGDDDSALAVA